MSADGTSAARVDETGSAMQGVLFSANALQVHAFGVYFEVQLQKVRVGEDDGLTLGVATGLPGALPDPPFETADDVPNAFCFGFDGKAVFPDRDDAIVLDWNPKDLQVNDRVGFLVTPQGEGQIFCNGQLKVSSVSGLPTAVPLFAVVDLLGSAAAVCLVPDAQPPTAGTFATLEAVSRKHAPVGILR